MIMYSMKDMTIESQQSVSADEFSSVLRFISEILSQCVSEQVNRGNDAQVATG